MIKFKSFINESIRVGRVQRFAAKAHEDWRKSLPPEEQKVPRIRSKNGGPKADINVPFDKLHPTAKQENLAAGRAALAAIKKHPKDIEKASDHVHNEWMKRNPKTKDNAHQHVPYNELPEDEKEKDRAHVRTMQGIKN